MATTTKRWYETLPALLTGLAALIGAITGLYVALGNGQGKSAATAPPVASGAEQPAPATADGPSQGGAVAESEPANPPAVDIESRWRELYPNPGNVSRIVQDGDAFTFTIEGRAGAIPFSSRGSGSITGRQIRSTYESTLPSTGRCRGSVTADGRRTEFECLDSMTGRYESAWVRE
jgi:hypothetical protein